MLQKLNLSLLSYLKLLAFGQYYELMLFLNKKKKSEKFFI